MSEEQKQAASLAHGLTESWKFEPDTEGWRVESPSGDACYLFNDDSEHGRASGIAIREVLRQLVGDLHFHQHEASALQAASAIQIPDCPTCRGNGMIGGPSYHAPDEGGEPCPDCWVPSAGKDAQPVGVAGKMPGTDGFTMACFKAVDVPFGTLLYAAPAAMNGPDERTVLRDLAQALAWQCFGECRGYSERLLSPREALEAARDVLGIPAAHAAPQAQPSDEEIDAIWKEGALRRDLEPSTRGVFRWSARALLSRYGAAPQAAIPEIEAMLRLCEDREWTDTNPKTALGQRLESVLMGLHNDLHEARDNAAPQAGEDARPVGEIIREEFVSRFGLDKGWNDIQGSWFTEGYMARHHATPQPAAQAAPAVPLLAKEHQGMRVDYSGLLQQAANALVLGGKATGLAEMLRQLQGHMTELGLRWYASDTAVVDDFCQLYCIGRDARAALTTQGASDGD